MSEAKEAVQQALENPDVQRIIRALHRLEKSWPEEARVWLFSAGGSLHLMATKSDGAREVGGVCAMSENMDPDLIIHSFNIPNEGGDW